MNERRREVSGGRRWAGWWLGAGALLCFLCSLLVWVSAPTEWLWIVAIVVTEWGHFAALGALLGAGFAFAFGFRLPAILALLAAVNFATPVLRATALARTLPTRVTTAFSTTAGHAHARETPLSGRDLFLGVPTSGVEVTELTYATDGSKALQLDLYQATDATERQPLIVMVHGGSWNGGNKQLLTSLNRWLARQHYAVAAINYRHAPKYRFPAAVDDVYRALDFLGHHAAEARLDLSRVVLIGRSAGGQIALAAAYSGKLPAVRGVVDFYAPADLVLGYEKPSRRWVLDSKTVLEKYLGGTPATEPEIYAAASPIRFVGPTTPPTLLIHGLLDPIVWPEQSELLAARLQSAGRPHLLLRLPWATHGCDANLSGPSGQLSLYAIDRFLAAVLAPSPTAPPP